MFNLHKGQLRLIRKLGELGTKTKIDKKFNFKKNLKWNRYMSYSWLFYVTACGGSKTSEQVKIYSLVSYCKREGSNYAILLMSLTQLWSCNCTPYTQRNNISSYHFTFLLSQATKKIMKSIPILAFSILSHCAF